MKKLSTGWKIFIYGSVFIWILIISAVIFSNEDSPQEIEQQKIDRLFSPYNGSHIELTKLIKSNLKDPDSFEHIKTSYEIKGDTIFVLTRYRAKNTFGGVVNESVNAITDKNTGEVLSWILQE